MPHPVLIDFIDPFASARRVIDDDDLKGPCKTSRSTRLHLLA